MVIDINTLKHTYTEFPDKKTLVQLFEEQVLSTPNNIAIIYDNMKLTYHELNKQSNQLAHYILNKYKIKPDDLITLILDRSEIIPIAILAVLKTGAAYVPVDPNYPDDRIRHILNDTKTKLILTNQHYQDKFTLLVNNNFDLMAVDGHKFDALPMCNPRTNLCANHLAYVIYTSGTTGAPKGVMIEHKSVINFIYDLRNRYKLNTEISDEVVLQFTNYVFDASVEQIWLALLSGYKLLLIPNQLWLDVNNFYNYLKNNLVTHIHATPTFLINYDFSLINTLRRLVSGGELLTMSCYKKLQFNNKITVINKYGPTEVTVDCLANIICDGDIGVGEPMSNVSIYVLDNKLQPISIGKIGELYVGGVGLARGYLNNPELTEEKFIVNPLQTPEEKTLNINSRIYKTGDRFKWNKSGKLEYIGRVDFQVKIEGHRIELAEVEAVINSYPNILQSVVIVDEHLNQNKLLVGYYVANYDIVQKKLMQYLRSKLPVYMVPVVLTKLEVMPVTINGKLDRKALPKPLYAKPVNIAISDVEKAMSKIWSDILGIEHIDTQVNFFDLGGTSLLAVQLKSAIEKEFNISLKITDIFTHSSIFLLCKNLLNQKSGYIIASNTQKIDFSNRKIAVIATSGAFASADNIQDYWSMICNGEEGVTFLSREQLQEFGVNDTLFKQENFVPVAAISKDMDKFDPEFWKITPNDAKLFDPQIRKFLEHAWIALEQSGYIKERQEQKVGVFAGMGHSQYYDTRIKSDNLTNPQHIWETTQINHAEFLSTRISYLLGLTGPAINISTACSTSLVAIIEACKNLFLHDCNIALAGGVYFNMPEYYGHLYQNDMVFSKDGHCKPFDKDASGIVRGAGVGVVVLKRLDDAIRDKDNIAAVISGYAVNNDGNRKIGYSAPSVAGQTECVLKAQQMAGITSDRIDYVECHGTGTKLGDPIEVVALHEAFYANTQTGKYNCILGSVKANIGHAITASGVAGFIKVCKMLQTKIIPPQINFQESNPHLQLDKTGFKIVTKMEPWNKPDKPMIAGVSSLGVGGTNAHIILEEHITDDIVGNSQNITQEKYYFLPFSAKSVNSYQRYAATLADYLEKNSNLELANIAYTLCKKREYFSYRGFIASSNSINAISMLRSISSPTYVKSPVNNIIFMFPGQGNQYTNMAYNLYVNETIFREQVDQCCELITKITGDNFKTYLYSQLTVADATILNETKWSQPALFTICYALAVLVQSMGVEADAYIGHSIGEYVAATLSGVFSLNDALKIVIKRGELMQQMPHGKMLSINATHEYIKELLTANLNISVMNSPNSLVVSGADDSINQFAEILAQKHIACTILHTSHAFHSPMMSEAAIEFEKYLHGITFNKPNKTFISNITGDFISHDDAISPQYWAKQICSSVQFSAGIQTLDKTYKNTICLEVGPGKSLSTFIKQHIDVKLLSISLLPTAKEFNEIDCIDSMQLFYNSIGKLWSLGYDLNWDNLTEMSDVHNIELPGYQFQKNRYWIDAPKILTQSFKDNIITEQTQELDLLPKHNILIDEEVSIPENTIANCFYEVLGIDKFSKHDSYFDLGGNSLSVFRLISLLNTQFKSVINMQTILQNNSVALLAKYFNNCGNRKPKYNLIVKLNNTTKQAILFMIHPSDAGCEVYLPVAKSLEHKFCCYGIDSHNLYNTNKISNISELAQYYLEMMILIMNQYKQTDYHILGWSLGGQIALEIATFLEAAGIKNITLYLLDTVLTDKTLNNLRKAISVDDYKKVYVNQSVTGGYNKLHIDRVLNNIKIDYKLVEQKISSSLKVTKALLFKAGSIHNRLNTKEFLKIQQHIISLPHNNLEIVFAKKDQLQVIVLNDIHHWGMVQHGHLLVPEILNFK